MVSLSEAQLERAAEAHDAYLLQFGSLREGAMAEYLKDTKGFGAIATDDPEKARSNLNRTKSLRREVAAIDDALFDRLAGIFGDTQLDGLEVVRLRRERDRLANQSAPAISAIHLQTAELRDAVPWQELDEASQASVHALITQWEERYTTLLQAWAKSQDSAGLAFVESIATLNARQKDFSPENPPAPEEIEELINVFREAQAANAQIVRPHADRVGTHILSGLQELADALPAEFRFEAVLDAGGGRRLQNRVEAAIRAARRGRVSDEALAEMKLIQQDWHQQAVPLLIEALAAEWQDQDDMLSGMMATAEDGSLAVSVSHGERLDAVRSRWNTLHDQTLEQIGALTPNGVDDLLAQFADDERESIPAERVQSSATVMVTSDGDGEDSGAVVVSATVSSSDPFSGRMAKAMSIPAINQTTINGISRDLDLDETGRAHLAALHEQHDTARAALEDARVTDRKAMRDELQDRMASGEALDQMEAMRVGMLMMKPISREGLDELDAAFFAGAETLAGDASLLEPWRLSRTRSLMEGGGMMSASVELVGIPDDRWRVDLLDVVETAGLSDQDHAAARAEIRDWHGPATDLHARVSEAATELDEGMQAMISAAEGGGQMNIDLEAAMRVEGLQQSLAERKSELASLTQTVIDAAIAATTDSDHLRRVWLEAAFPDFVVGGAFDRLYDRAADLDDLTDEQRGAIAMLRSEHDDGWWTATDEAVALIITERESPSNQQEAFFRMQEVRSGIDRITFARREAAIKHLERLRTILTKPQLASADGLPDPAEPHKLALPF